MKTSQLSQDTGHSDQARLWFDAGHDDIARMIERTIAPYVDHGNVALQHDELRDECWFKVVKLLTSCSIDRCETRQQFFGLVKVSLRNYVKSLVHKHAYTMKRTGLPVPPKAKVGVYIEYGKTEYVRLDDPDESFELEANDSAMQFDALVSDFTDLLSPSERLMLQDMIASGAEHNATSVQRLRKQYAEFMKGEPNPARAIKLGRRTHLKPAGPSITTPWSRDLSFCPLPSICMTDGFSMARENVISFRLNSKQFAALNASLKRDKPVGVRSENHLARKIVNDFLEERLRYTNENDRFVDHDQFFKVGTRPQSEVTGKLPTGMRFSKVQSALEKELAFAPQLKDRTEIVFSPDGSQTRYSHLVIGVTEAIHKRGRDAFRASQKEIIRTAIDFLRRDKTEQS